MKFWQAQGFYGIFSGLRILNPIFFCKELECTLEMCSSHLCERAAVVACIRQKSFASRFAFVVDSMKLKMVKITAL